MQKQVSLQLNVGANHSQNFLANLLHSKTLVNGQASTNRNSMISENAVGNFTNNNSMSMTAGVDHHVTAVKKIGSTAVDPSLFKETKSGYTFDTVLYNRSNAAKSVVKAT